MPFGVSIFPALPEISDEELASIGAILQRWRGFSLAVYKDTCMVTCPRFSPGIVILL